MPNYRWLYKISSFVIFGFEPWLQTSRLKTREIYNFALALYKIAIDELAGPRLYTIKVSNYSPRKEPPTPVWGRLSSPELDPESRLSNQEL